MGTETRTTRKHEKGAVLAFLSIALPVLVAGLGLAIDNGAMYELKRRLQTAADAGAIAGAQEIRRENWSAIPAAVRADAKKNGFENGEDMDSKVTVNRPPTEGRYAGDGAFVEVIVEERAPLFFMRAFMDEGYLVRARAVAGARPDDHCAFALASSGDKAFLVAGTADAHFDCGIQVNSNDTGGALDADGGGQITAKRFDVRGTYEGDGFTPEPITGAPPMADPLAHMQAPEFGACDWDKTRINDERTIDPGVYCRGLEFRAQADVTMNPGLYVINGGGLTIRGGAEIAGDGITFYITESPGRRYGPIEMTGGGALDLDAPTSGPYKGILVFEDPTLTDTGKHKFTGGSNTTLSGAVYTPHADMSFGGNYEGASSALKLMLIADTVEIHGNPSFTGLDASQMPIEMLIPRVVE